MDATQGSEASTSLLGPLNGKFIYKKNEDGTINKNAVICSFCKKELLQLDLSFKRKIYLSGVVGNALQSNALEYSNYFFRVTCNVTRFVHQAISNFVIFFKK